MNLPTVAVVGYTNAVLPSVADNKLTDNEPKRF